MEAERRLEVPDCFLRTRFYSDDPFLNPLRRFCKNVESKYLPDEAERSRLRIEFVQIARQLLEMRSNMQDDFSSLIRANLRTASRLAEVSERVSRFILTEEDLESYHDPIL